MSLAFGPTRIPPSRGDANGKRLLTASETLSEAPATPSGLIHNCGPPQSENSMIRTPGLAARTSGPKSGISESDLSAATEYQQFSRTPISAQAAF
jgi:hypothetical protein